MNYIDSVDILGFWGNKNVHINFHEDVNFLIGANGSGKTTIINLISAVLRADISVLYSEKFKKIVIGLKAIGANRKPQIEVSKVVDSEMGNFKLEFVIKGKASDQGASYVVEGPDENRIYNEYILPKHSRFREDGQRLGQIIAELVEVNWLSIHRTNISSERLFHHQEVIESPIDQKMDEISQSFSNYFSLLSSKAEAESKSFQENVFLSLLDQSHDTERVFQEANADTFNKVDAIGVLEDFGISKSKATKSVNSHYSRIKKANERMHEENAREFNLADAFTLSDTLRIIEMVQKWKDLQSKISAIFLPRNIFEDIINKLFSGKEIHFDARNTPKVHLRSGDKVDISVLSSGEKQLFILLGEALLQEERPVVFISDEPELSLHVDWQSSLFSNVRKLNSSCQVISATHSPDIVGRFQKNIIKVEDCISDV